MALLVSVGTLIWTIWMRQRDGARLAVKATWSMMVGDLHDNPELVCIEAVNVGRSGVTVVESLKMRIG